VVVMMMIMMMMMGKVRWRVPAVEHETLRRLVQFRGNSWSPLITSVAIGGNAAPTAAEAAVTKSRCSNCCLSDCVDQNKSSPLTERWQLWWW